MSAVLERVEIDDNVYEPVLIEPGRMVLRLPPGLINSEKFFEICQMNDLLRLEREANGDIIVMAPTAGSSSRRNSKISSQLEVWSDRTQIGEAFDSSGGYELPDGSVASPDASWITSAQWDGLTPEQKDRFLPLCPVFAVELLSPSDRLSTTRKKMRTYLANGTRLAWLINPRKKQVEVYEPEKEPVVLEDPTNVSADPVLPGFVLDLIKMW